MDNNKIAEMTPEQRDTYYRKKNGSAGEDAEQVKATNKLKELKSAMTCDLVRALQSREGVEVKIAEPYQDVDIHVNGPAIVLVVID